MSLALRVVTRLDFSHFRAGDPPAPRPTARPRPIP